jgi:hypothetical protein
MNKDFIFKYSYILSVSILLVNLLSRITLKYTFLWERSILLEAASLEPLSPDSAGLFKRNNNGHNSVAGSRATFVIKRRATY